MFASRRARITGAVFLLAPLDRYCGSWLDSGGAAGRRTDSGWHGAGARHTVAVRIGFDDYRTLGAGETGGRAALPVFREIMARVYANGFAGAVPKFPASIEEGIDRYLGANAHIGARQQGAEQTVPISYSVSRVP